MTTKSKQGHPTMRIRSNAPGSDRHRHASAIARTKRLEHLGNGIRQVGRFSAKSGAIGAFAVGALAVGALSVGALAVGALAIQRLAVGKAHIRSLKIDKLDVRELHVSQFVDADKLTTPAT